MKYPVENKEINNVEDLLARIAEEEANYQKEKEEFLADKNSEGKMLDGNLYMQYHKLSCNIIHSMTRHLDKKRAYVLSPYLGEPHKDPTSQRDPREFFSFSADAILTCIEKGKVDKLLTAIKSIKTQSIDEKIHDRAQYEIDRENEEHVYKRGEFTAEQAIQEKGKVQHEKVTHLDKGKAFGAADAVNNGNSMAGQYDEAHNKRTYNDVKTNTTHTISKDRSGRGRRLYDYETINGKKRANLGSTYEFTEEEIPDVHFADRDPNSVGKDFDKVAGDLESFRIRINNVKHNKLLFTACGLNMVKELDAIRQSRTFWQKFFHPFRNSNEKDLIDNLKTDLLRGGVSTEQMEEAKTSDRDYLEEYKVDYLESYKGNDITKREKIYMQYPEAENKEEEIIEDEKTEEKVNIIDEVEEEEEKVLD